MQMVQFLIGVVIGAVLTVSGLSIWAVWYIDRNEGEDRRGK